MTEIEAEMSDTLTRLYWNQKAEIVQSDEDVADFLALLRVVDKNSFQIALPTLCIVAAKVTTEPRKQEFEVICANVLLDPETTRPSLRAVLACLKEFRRSDTWTDFYTLVEALEEPQFHIIRPILPRFDTLLQSVAEHKLQFIWAKIALFRAMIHTNGWIRVWAIEKSVAIDSRILERHFEFIPYLLIPHLNNNDVFWRLLEKGKMESFLSTISSLFEAIKSTPTFFTHLLNSLETISCPTSMYFVVSALRDVTCAEILEPEDVPLMRRVVLKTRYIPHKSMRIVTIINLVVFYAKVTKLNSAVLEELANLIAYISPDATQSMLSDVFSEIQKVIVSTEYTPSGEHNDETFAPTKNIAEHAKMWWLAMTNDKEKQEKILSRLQLDVAEILTERPEDRELTKKLFLLKERPDDVECTSVPDAFSLLKNEIGEYILTQIISNQGSKFEFQLLHSLYIPLFFEYCSHMFLPFAMAIAKILPDSSRNCESTALLLTFFDAILEKIPESLDVLAGDFFQYLGGKDVIGMGRQKKSIDEYETKEFNHIVASLHSLRIKLLNKFTATVDDSNAFLLECVEQLDVASAFPVKQQICRLIARFIPSPDCECHVALQCIRACGNIVNEEKKSLNSLPALEAFVDVALCAPQHTFPELARETILMLESQMLIASQSHPVALILIDALAKYNENLNVTWAPLIVKLALFGPVPKKESRVLSFAYQKVFEEEDQLLKHDQIERLDEIVQKTRFKAVQLAIKLASEDVQWQNALIDEIFETSAVMDQSSSRSFGLSMAHRQKTRAVELLHLLADRVQDETFALRIFDFCIACVVDPCQQFSIKLIVEWTLAKLCIKFERLFQKIVDKDFEVYTFYNSCIIFTRKFLPVQRYKKRLWDVSKQDVSKLGRFKTCHFKTRTVQNFECNCASRCTH
uniref:Uncharacterized protein n=1 Tax=Caenorhabditis japonica TaxID=281687 RepID=A0A8R1HXF9_CAEJA